MESFLLSKGEKMSQEIRGNNRIQRKRVIIGIIIAAVIYLIINLLSTFSGGSKSTVLPDPYILYDKLPAEGIIIKKETVYKAEGSGQLNLLMNEGEKIPVGVEVANISLLNDNSQIKQELVEIDQRIEMLSKPGLSSDKDVQEDNNLESYNNQLIEKIQKDVNSDNFINIHIDKEEIRTKQDFLNNDSNLLNQSLESLKAKRETYIKQISSNNIRYYSGVSGILSYVIDGYEEILLPVDFENYTYDELIFEEVSSENDVTSKSDVLAGKPIFKIIKSYEWYIAIKIVDKKDVSDYDVGQPILIELDNDTELNGKIINKNVTGNKVVLIVKNTDYLHNIYNQRFNNIEIVKSKKEGFRIPTSTITDNAGIKGVYIKDINGIVKFRPILILEEVGEYTIINKGNNNGYIEVSGEETPVRTVTLYDEIFLKPSSVIEGEILR